MEFYFPISELQPGAFLYFNACLFFIVGVLLFICNFGLRKIDIKSKEAKEEEEETTNEKLLS